MNEVLKRTLLWVMMTFAQIAAFAQRGKVRPEWDIESSHSYHSVNDDMYFFLFIICIILVVFIIAAIKRLNNKSKKKQNYKTSKTYEVIGKVGDVYNTIGGEVV